MEYQMRNSFTERFKESSRLLNKYHDRVPIIVERGKTKELDKGKIKFLVPRSITISQFMYVLRKKIKMNSEEAIYLFSQTNCSIPQASTIQQIYTECKSEDGFLYLIYSLENTFGTFTPIKK